MSKPRKPKRANKAASKPPAKRGPKPMTLAPFDGTFEQAIDRALSKKRPARGWPK